MAADGWVVALGRVGMTAGRGHCNTGWTAWLVDGWSRGRSGRVVGGVREEKKGKVQLRVTVDGQFRVKDFLHADG